MTTGLAACVTALILALATGSGAYMLTKTEVSAPLRVWVAEHSRNAQEKDRWLLVKLDALLSCPYCTGTWLALIAVLIYRPVLVTVPDVRPGFSFWPLGYLVSVMAVNGTAMFVVLGIKKALGK